MPFICCSNLQAAALSCDCYIACCGCFGTYGTAAQLRPQHGARVTSRLLERFRLAQNIVVGLSSSPKPDMFSGWGRNKQDGQPDSPVVRGPAATKARSAAQPGAHGVPLELVRYDTESGKFHVGEQALKVLRATKDPVGVVAVCGRARQGKSFILNQLLGQSTGFQVAPSVRPCTKGLWMWSAPIKRQDADGSQYQLVCSDQPLLSCSHCTAQQISFSNMMTVCRSCSTLRA